jgi:hypothetical protein
MNKLSNNNKATKQLYIIADRTLVLYPYSHEDYLRDNAFVEKAMTAIKEIAGQS